MYSLQVPEENSTPNNQCIDIEIERLMNAYGNDVLKTSYFYLKDKQMAEDVYQEVFLRIYKKYESFENRSSEKTWVLKITINVCKDLLRSSWLKRVFLMDKIKPETTCPGVDSAVIKLSENKLLYDAVLSLQTAFKTVVILYYYEELSTAEISKVLDISEGTVRSRLHRAREALKKKLYGRVDVND